MGRIAIDAGDSEEQIDNITEKAQGLSETLGGVGTGANNTGNTLGSGSKFGSATVWLGNMWTKLTSVMYQAGKTVAQTGLDFNADMEKYTTSFATMMGGNTEAAEAFVEEIREMAAVTPMEMTGLAANAQTLLGYNVAAEDVIETLNMLGDVAIGDQERLNHIVLAYGQMMGAGKLMAQDANQFVQAGVPLWSLLAEHIGATVGEVREMSAEGQITSDVVNEVLKNATSEGGLFFEAMENQSTTYLGLMARLSDDFAMTTGSLFEPFFDETKETIIPGLTQSLVEFNEWIEANKTSIDEFAESVGTLATDGFTLLTTAVQKLIEIDAEDLWWIEIIGGTAALLTGHYGVGLGLFAAAGYTEDKIVEGMKESDQANRALAIDEAIGDFFSTGDIGALRDAIMQPEKEEKPVSTKDLTTQQALLRYLETGDPTFLIKRGDVVKGFEEGAAQNGTTFQWEDPNGRQGNTSELQTAVEGLTAAAATIDGNAMAETIASAVAAEVSAAIGSIQVSTGNVYLNTGALVGQIIPAINVGMGRLSGR